MTEKKCTHTDQIREVHPKDIAVCEDCIKTGDEWVAHAKTLRERWLADGTPMGERFGSLVRELKDRAK